MQLLFPPAPAAMPVRRTRAARRAGAALLAACAGFVAVPLVEVTGGSAAEAAARPRKATAGRQSERKQTPDEALEQARGRNSPAAPPVPAQNPRHTKEGKSSAIPALASSDAKPLTGEQKKAAVLAAPADVLRRVGRHVITGYYAPSQLTPLIERGALGGVFVTARNARRRNFAALAGDLDGMRRLAAAAGQNAFWISTDQEGGSVSRLSPPLPYQVSLPRMLRDLKPADLRSAKVESYAAKQAAGLASLGINLNFAPVADLNHNMRSSADRFTRIRNRAISDKADVVTEVARTYCEQFKKANVYCTLKHFPGLGRLANDTHVTAATLKAPAEELARTDWLPFRRVLEQTPAFVMVGHHQVASLDAERPASTSPVVVQKMLREEWKFDGVVVTDDLVMGAIAGRKGGMAAAAVDALNAGVDLVLIGAENDAIYEVLHALITADAQGRLDPAKLAASAQRLAKAAVPIALSRKPDPTAPPLPMKAPKTKTARQ